MLVKKETKMKETVFICSWTYIMLCLSCKNNYHGRNTNGKIDLGNKKVKITVKFDTFHDEDLTYNFNQHFNI